jgi:hypothetical protein
MSRRLFAAGCWVLIALGVAHLLGHYNLVTAVGETDAERQLLELMRGHKQDLGAGFVRSTMDILSGFSLAFTVLSAGFGLLGLVVLRRGGGDLRLLREAAIVGALVFGAMTGVALVYWFAIPLTFLAVAFVCFLASLFTARRA